MNEFLPPLFSPGEVKIVESAGAAMARAGQDADYFLQMHVRGIWCEEFADGNKQSLQTGSMILNSYHTLLGEVITVVTFSDRRQTGVLGPLIDNLGPSARHHIGYTYDAGPTCDCNGPGLDSSTTALPEETCFGNFPVGTDSLSSPSDDPGAAYNYTLSGVDSSEVAKADDVEDDYAPWHMGAQSDSVSDPSGEEKPNLIYGDCTETEEGPNFQCYNSGLDKFKFLGLEPLGYSPNMMYDCHNTATDTSSSTPSPNDTPPDEERRP